MIKLHRNIVHLATVEMKAVCCLVAGFNISRSDVSIKVKSLEGFEVKES